jgi:hypothetical protein
MNYGSRNTSYLLSRDAESSILHGEGLKTMPSQSWWKAAHPHPSWQAPASLEHKVLRTPAAPYRNCFTGTLNATVFTSPLL